MSNEMFYKGNIFQFTHFHKTRILSLEVIIFKNGQKKCSFFLSSTEAIKDLFEPLSTTLTQVKYNE